MDSSREDIRTAGDSRMSIENFLPLYSNRKSHNLIVDLVSGTITSGIEPMIFRICRIRSEYLRLRSTSSGESACSSRTKSRNDVPIVGIADATEDGGTGLRTARSKPSNRADSSR